MADKGRDPVELWQSMIGEMEKGLNAFANKAMAAPEYSQVVNQIGGISAGAQRQLSELMERYLKSLNLPSREQLAGVGERLLAIESQLNEITALLRQLPGQPATGAKAAAVPKPPRTRRPPSAGARK